MLFITEGERIHAEMRKYWFDFSKQQKQEQNIDIISS